MAKIINFSDYEPEGEKKTNSGGKVASQIKFKLHPRTKVRHLIRTILKYENIKDVSPKEIAYKLYERFKSEENYTKSSNENDLIIDGLILSHSIYKGIVNRNKEEERIFQEIHETLLKEFGPSILLTASSVYRCFFSDLQKEDGLPPPPPVVAAEMPTPKSVGGKILAKHWKEERMAE